MSENVEFSDEMAFLGVPEPFNIPDSDSVLLLATFNMDEFESDLYEHLQIDRPETLSKAVDKRQAEYLAGRALANHAIRHLGGQASQIPIGQDRAPIWPDGIHGSISHTKGQVACLMTKRLGHFVGVDIERDLSESGLRSVKKVVLQASERSFLSQQSKLSETQMAGAIFSAKETLFKALYPIVQRVFGFNAAACITVTNTALRMELTQDLHATLPMGRVFDVELRLLDGYLLTWLIHHDA